MAQATRRCAVVAALLASTAICCGGEEEPKPSGPPLAAPARPKRAQNRPPTLEQVQIEPRDPVPGTVLRAVVQASDPDDDPLRFVFEWRRDGSLLDARGAALALPDPRKGERIELEVTASDGLAESNAVRDATTFRNRPPAIAMVPLDASSPVEPGSEVRAEPRANDPDGDPIRYRYVWLVNGEEISTDGPVFSTEGLSRGDVVRVRVFASDGEDEGRPMEGSALEIGNTPPTIVSAPPSVPSDGVFRYVVEARDPDGDRNLRFRLASGPKGMQVDPVVGAVTWQPEPSQAGDHRIEVVVEDPHGGATAQRFQLTVSEMDDAEPASAVSP